MYIKERVNSHFLDLVDDANFASMYFSDKDINEYNNGKLEELKKNIAANEIRYKKVMSLLNTISSFNNSDLLPKVTSAVERDYIFLMCSINDLKLFENDLAYLIISSMIKIDNVRDLGFDKEYIDALLTKYNELLQHPYTEYYYDEKMDKVSQVDDDGKLIELTNVPLSVQKKINKQKVISKINIK